MKVIQLEDDLRPERLFQVLAHEPHSFFLDHADMQKPGFSFLGAFPYRIVYSIDELQAELVSQKQGIKNLSNPILAEIPYCGGGVGFISYEASALWEKNISFSTKQPFSFPKIMFGFYDTFFCYDHTKKKYYLISLELNSKSSVIFQQLLTLYNTCKASSIFYPQKNKSKNLHVETNFTVDKYCNMIMKAQKFIREGEIYQVNLSQYFSILSDEDPYTVYLKLRQYNPASFAAYLNFGGYHILCSSPERFLRVTLEGSIQTEPIKGTVGRGGDVKEDKSMKEYLLNSSKNRAELMMIVDLERNDLGKICEIGSITVPVLYELRSYATVHHLVSVIRGKLITTHAAHILKACFPGGSITGAPKLRAMQIIEMLEPHNRGIYTGCIGYIDYRGQMDLNIAIRTMIYRDYKYIVPVGGGITNDSEPWDEYRETLHKGKALINAVLSEQIHAETWAINSSTKLLN